MTCIHDIHHCSVCCDEKHATLYREMEQLREQLQQDHELICKLEADLDEQDRDNMKLRKRLADQRQEYRNA